MTTTATLELAGTVPALPAELIPVAEAARDLPVRTWGVVIWPDQQPTLAAGELGNQIVAGRLAEVLAGTYGQAVFVVYRCPTAVTVHTSQVGRRGNTLGTMTVRTDQQLHTRWSQLVQWQSSAERDALIIDAMRHAHHLPAGTTAGQVLLYALGHPIDQVGYLTAYAEILAGGLHAYAEREHRREHTHRVPF